MSIASCQVPSVHTQYTLRSIHRLCSPFLKERPGRYWPVHRVQQFRSLYYELQGNTKNIKDTHPYRVRSGIYEYTIYKCIHKLYSQNLGWFILNDVWPGAHIDGCSINNGPCSSGSSWLGETRCFSHCFRFLKKRKRTKTGSKTWSFEQEWATYSRDVGCAREAMIIHNRECSSQLLSRVSPTQMQ